MKKTGILILMFAVLLSLAGCGKSQGNADVPSSTPLTLQDKMEKTLEGMPTLVGDIPCTFPLVSEPAIIKVLATLSSARESYGDVYIWKKYEELTGVSVEWTTVTRDERSARVRDALSKKLDYDLIFRAKTSQNSIRSYGESGLVLDLASNGLLETYAPNCWAYLQSHPDTLASIMSPDGSIYALPQVNSGAELRVSRKIYINRNWLETVDMELPSTLEEFYQILVAFKEMDANGNGDTTDEIPMSPLDWESMKESFYGAFGLGNRGQHNMMIDSDPVRLIAAAPEYRQFLEFFNKLYEEGLIDPFLFSSSDTQVAKELWQNHIAEDKIGVFAHTNLAEIPANLADNWIAIEEALEGPGGDKLWAAVRANFNTTGAAMIPATCTDPGLVLQWLDYFWTDEGTLFYHMGIEGETFEKKEDGSFDYMPYIYQEALEQDLTFDQAVVRYSPYPGGGNPTVEIAPYFMGGEMAAVPAEAARKLFEYRPEICWPAFTFTNEENTVIEHFQGDITKYCDTARTAFITGARSFDTWDDYLSQLNSMGLSDLLAVYQAAADRFSAMGTQEAVPKS